MGYVGLKIACVCVKIVCCAAATSHVYSHNIHKAVLATINIRLHSNIYPFNLQAEYLLHIANWHLIIVSENHFRYVRHGVVNAMLRINAANQPIKEYKQQTSITTE